MFAEATVAGRESHVSPASAMAAFDLGQPEAYRAWREHKLARYPSAATELIVEVQNLMAPTAAEHAALLDCLSRANMVIYRTDPERTARDAVRAFGEHFGLRRLDNHLCAEEDGISELRVNEGGPQAEYIPYTDRPINWHTDGYYNPPERRIAAMLLHCISDAADGGENALIDHELLYIRLRDENPDFIAALMHPQAMTIPPNVENGVELRPCQTGPVFSVDSGNGRLHMRYTARARNIEWRDDPMTRAAVTRIGELLAGDAGIFHYRLRPGEGLLCNNVLHNRTGFRDAAGHNRLILRARYFDRVAHT